MPLTLQADPLPLHVDEFGTIRVGKSRVSLELLIHAHQDGQSAEQMARRFDTIELADIHAVLAYYLRHKEEVEDYLSRREAEAEAIRHKIESTLTQRISREELKARWSQRQEP
jgi:uncharacterized protein (DUF433 family)